MIDSKNINWNPKRNITDKGEVINYFLELIKIYNPLDDLVNLCKSAEALLRGDNIWE